MSALATIAAPRISAARSRLLRHQRRSTGPHVHYEVRMNNAPINPWRYMKAHTAGD